LAKKRIILPDSPMAATAQFRDGKIPCRAIMKFSPKKGWRFS
jgi:hypothetical protein